MQPGPAIEKLSAPSRFASLNRAYGQVFQPGALSVGLVVPIERYADGPVPSMDAHIERVQLAERLGFSAVWLRDVPFNVASFGDAGQLFDPFVYLGLLAGLTRDIALGVASIVLPLRHPAHVAKAAASVDVLSGGRLLLGVASGDRPAEYPAFAIDPLTRGERFREAYDYIRKMAQPAPQLSGIFGTLGGDEPIAMLPKPAGGRLPLLITGSSQQSPDWLAAHGDGWMSYPRAASVQEQAIADYRSRSHASGVSAKPVMEPLYIDLAEHPDHPPQAIHLGYRLGVNRLRSYLAERRSIGVNHVALNLRFNRADTHATLLELAEVVLPEFPINQNPI